MQQTPPASHPVPLRGSGEFVHGYFREHGDTTRAPRFPAPARPYRLPTQGLLSTIGNFPTSEKGSIYSLRIDHIWNAKNNTFVRAMVSPDSVTGIQVNAQNQTFGQNAGNRTSTQQTHDWALIAQHTTAIRR